MEARLVPTPKERRTKHEEAGYGIDLANVNIVDRREPAAEAPPFGTRVDASGRRDVDGDSQVSLLRMIGHELRTPLQALSMLVELMRRESEKGRPSAKESFSRVKGHLDRLSSLATDLTDARKIVPAAVGRRGPGGERPRPPEGRGDDASREPLSRILIVDDDMAILGALEELLSDRYEVLVAGNGEEAVDQLASAPVDLVVLDMLMPVLDGEGALREIRERGLRVPVIVVSARSDRLANYRELGADDFIQKPFEVAVLEQKIDRLLAAAG